MQLSFLPPVIYFSSMHLQNKFYPLAPNQETNSLSAILGKYIGRKCIWWTFIKHQWGPLWHARFLGHEEHEFEAGLSIAQGPSVATRKKEFVQGWRLTRAAKRNGVFLLLIMAPWQYGVGRTITQNREGTIRTGRERNPTPSSTPTRSNTTLSLASCPIVLSSTLTSVNRYAPTARCWQLLFFLSRSLFPIISMWTPFSSFSFLF